MIQKICKNCNKVFYTYPSRIKIGKGLFCSKKCHNILQRGKKPWNAGKKCPSLSLAKKGNKNPMWKGGISKKEGDRRYSLTINGINSHNKARKRWLSKPGSKEKILERRRRYTKENIHYRIKRNISNAVWCKLNRYRGIKKDGRISDCLPYNIDELKIHLENQFTEGMSWDNYGKWHIDHIIPDSSFKYTSMEDIEFQKSWSLDNLRPLWAKENLIKGKRLLAIDK